jgi:hypothetical protein
VLGVFCAIFSISLVVEAEAAAVAEASSAGAGAADEEHRAGGEETGAAAEESSDAPPAQPTAVCATRESSVREKLIGGTVLGSDDDVGRPPMRQDFC